MDGEHAQGIAELLRADSGRMMTRGRFTVEWMGVGHEMPRFAAALAEGEASDARVGVDIEIGQRPWEFDEVG